MDSNDTKITITTGSINGQQTETEIEVFVRHVTDLAHQVLSNSTIKIDIVKHRIIEG